MIKFSLVCANGHEFESWFRSGAAYEGQAKAALIACPACQETDVRKAIMSPAIAQPREPLSRPDVSPRPAPPALFDQRDQNLRAAIRELRARILEHAEDVGAQFPDEARRIHEGDAAERAIRGQATFEEARALIEDGIGLMPIPVLPDDFQ